MNGLQLMIKTLHDFNLFGFVWALDAFSNLHGGSGVRILTVVCSCWHLRCILWFAFLQSGQGVGWPMPEKSVDRRWCLGVGLRSSHWTSWCFVSTWDREAWSTWMLSIWALRIRFEIRGSWIMLKEVPMILAPLLMICGSGSQLSRRSPNEAQTQNACFGPKNFLN